jgi:hypothetical protein
MKLIKWGMRCKAPLTFLRGALQVSSTFSIIVSPMRTRSIQDITCILGRDKLYEKRKAGALEVEHLVKQLAAQVRHSVLG